MMETKSIKRELPLQDCIRLLKADGYRGFRLSEREVWGEPSMEVGARSNTGIMLIAIGTSIDEAYGRLIERIDETLDG